MNKTAKYTALTLFLAVVFSFGSMAGMDYILLTRERQLLTESGRAVVETPVRAWQEPGMGKWKTVKVLIRKDMPLQRSKWRGFLPTGKNIRE